MFKFLELSKAEQRQVINESSNMMNIDPFMIEKDFWVVYILDVVFNKSKYCRNFAFKGGTSLSKAYKAINRFSEDIDIVLNWTQIGYTTEEPWLPRSKTKQEIFNKEANNRASRFIKEELLPDLASVISESRVMDIRLDIAIDDDQAIEIIYPRLFASSYSLQTIRLEIGPLASWTPSVNRVVQTYVTETFPDTFNEEVIIPTVEAKRTFWEKAVILHREANRGKNLTYRYARHYYDLHMLSLSNIKDEALADMRLLHHVVDFNKKFYPIGAAKFDEATPGTFRLCPNEQQLNGLKKDYLDMHDMFFGEVIPFEQVMDGIAKLEVEINHT